METFSKTAQEIFDEIIRYAATAKERSRAEKDDKEVCLYRKEDGNACFIGALIPDSVTHLTTNTDSVKVPLTDIISDVNSLCLYYPEVEEYIVPSDMDESFCKHFLADLQTVHDNAHNWGIGGFVGWHAFESVAERYDLNTNVLEEVKSEAGKMVL